MRLRQAPQYVTQSVEDCVDENWERETDPEDLVAEWLNGGLSDPPW